ncbi:MAG: ATP-dependent metallopeptidase FtsH/Yme1/Tma family protein, partial [Bradyrhizobium guangdongense]
MEKDSSSRQQSVAIGYIFAAGILMVLLQWAFAAYSAVESIPYSQFEQLVAQGKVAEVSVGQDVIQGKLKENEKLSGGKTAFVTARVDLALAAKLDDKGIIVTGVPSGGLFQTILSWIVPALMFYLVWVFLGRRFAERQGFGGLMSIGKSRAKVYVETDTKVTFADVAGVEEAKFELQEVVSFLKDPKSYGRLDISTQRCDGDDPGREALPCEMFCQRVGRGLAGCGVGLIHGEDNDLIRPHQKRHGVAHGARGDAAAVPAQADPLRLQRAT